MLTSLQQKLKRRYTDTECYGTLIVNGPPTESENVQSIGSVASKLKKRYTNTEMCGTLILSEPPTTEHGPTLGELKQGLKRRYTDTEMCGTLIVHGIPTTSTEHPRSKWFDPMSEVKMIAVLAAFDRTFNRHG